MKALKNVWKKIMLINTVYGTIILQLITDSPPLFIPYIQINEEYEL